MRTSRALVTTAMTAGTVVLSAMITPGVASADDSHGHWNKGTTTIVLNPALVPVLVDTLEVAPIKPGMLSAPGGVAQVSFPITKVEKDEIEHSGGLRFTPVGGGSLKITEFEVELTDKEISADKTWLNGKQLGEVDIFDLGKAKRINGSVPSCDGVQAGLYLTSEAAGALGAPDFTGAFVGDACVVPKTH
jgi:hypothetical protein